MYDQHDSIMKTLGNGARLGKNDTCILGGLSRHEEEIVALDNILIVACGSSH